jgi:hypothetical protein
MRKFAIASILILAASPPYASHGQLALTDEPPPTLIHSNYVIEVGANAASPEVLNIIAASLRPRLPNWPKTLGSSETWVDNSIQDADLNDARIYRLFVNVRSDELQPSDAEMHQLWEVARKQLEAELNRITGDVAKSQRDRLEVELQRLDATRHSEGDVTELIEQLAARQAASAGAEGNFSQGLAEVYSKQRELKLREAGLQARREAIERRIDQVRAEADASTQEDAIVKELAKVLEIREKTRQRLGQINDKTPQVVAQGELLEADAQLAQARIELLKAKRDVEDRAGGGHLRALNDELSKLLVESAEIEGQRKELEQIIAEIRKNVRETALAMGEAENLKVKIQTVRSRLAEEDARINDLRREYERLEPQSVTLRPLTVDKSDPSEPEASAPGASD